MGSTANTVSDLVRRYYASYDAKDRQACERLLSEDFKFSSPRDDHIDRASYFARCWPNSEKYRATRIERLFVEDNQAFVRYECEKNDGGKFRCVEFLTIEGGKIAEVEVYFGSL